MPETGSPVRSTEGEAGTSGTAAADEGGDERTGGGPQPPPAGAGTRARVLARGPGVARGGPWGELTRLVVQHFAPELEVALRAAFQEVVGRPLPPRFTLTLGNPPQQTSEAADRPCARRSQGRRAVPLKRDCSVAKPLPAGEAG